MNHLPLATGQSITAVGLHDLDALTPQQSASLVGGAVGCVVGGLVGWLSTREQEFALQAVAVTGLGVVAGVAGLILTSIVVRANNPSQCVTC